MAQVPHVPRTHSTVRRLALGSHVAVGVTVLLTVTLIVLPFAVPEATDAPVLLFIVAIGLCAARFQLRGGVLAALMGVGVASLWLALGRYAESGVIDYVLQAGVFVLVGTFVGSVAAERETLRETVSRHHEGSLDLICTASFDGYFTSLNPAWEEALGYSRAELMSRPFTSFIHPDDVAPTEAEFVRQTEVGELVLNFQNRYRHADGSWRWLEWTSRPDAERQELHAVARDITARKEAEGAITTYRHRLERAVDERTAELRDRRDELEERGRELEASRMETLRRLGLAAEYRDDETFEHTERVGHNAALIAKELGYVDSFVRLIRQAAPLHDVGKLGLSDTILLKQGPLTAEEFEAVKRHTIDGASILGGSTSDVLQLAEQIALGHHEWWNGAGYPHGVYGDLIPLSARIVAVADVFDALVHSRPYKRAWSLEDALEEVQRLSGEQFDPRVVEAFLRFARTAPPLRGHDLGLGRVA